ncbi:transglycosylase domain-containing protein, partial [Microbacterium schleiferi]|uniref:transglycosylase domain-containing protein n=1 Tax=Microbacterium schleiferi TaxID=69362 RepID=UPI0035C7D115
MPETKRTAGGVLGGLLGVVGLSAVAGVLVAATVTPAIALSGAAASSAITLFDNLPSALEIDELMLPTTFYWMNPDTGEYEVMTQFYDQNRDPVTFDEVAPVMYNAILSSEDKNFYSHGGVDLVGTARAVISGGSQGGGSSISQQYVKNILIQKCEAEVGTGEDADMTQEEIDAAKIACFEDATVASGVEGYQRKLQEMRYAIALEQKYSKDEILLGYLNIANFGGQNYGIGAAAHYYFGVSPADLTLGQAAALAGMVQTPNLYRLDRPDGSWTDKDGNPINSAADGYSLTKERQTYVLNRMLADGKITQEEHDAAVAEPIVPVITPADTGCGVVPGKAAYFCQYARGIMENDEAFGATKEERTKLLKQGGLNVYLTIDRRLQAAAEQAMVDNVPTSIEGYTNADTGRLGAATTSIETKTGRILEITQNTNFSETIKDDANYSSLVYAGNQKYGNSNGFEGGSTFKVFTLLQWLQEGHSVNEVLNGNVQVFKTFRNSCYGDITNNTTLINNFAKSSGYVGTPMRFTADSLNTGFLAMASKLDLCGIENTVAKMGVTLGNGEPVQVRVPFAVLGPHNIAPIDVASAYATIANNGVHCTPKAIDRITYANGNEIALPEASCTQVLEPNVAATAAYALQGVMTNGSGRASNPYDGTPILGKTGTHEAKQTWLVGSSTNVTTAVWVGNSVGDADVSRWPWNHLYTRHSVAKPILRAANALYGGDGFPAPDPNLTKTVLYDLPNVVGQSVEAATKTLEDAGFEVIVGDAVNSTEGAGIVAQQDPGGGKVAGGTVVTIYPSNGQGVTVPAVSGSVDQARNTLQGAGLNVTGGTCNNPAATATVTGTSPGAGTMVGRGSTVNINVNCTAPGPTPAPRPP